MSSNDHIVSTGRGGAGNIGHDPRVYTDGALVREGVQGESSEPEYSTGRGGAGNISTPLHGTPDPHAHSHAHASSAAAAAAGRRSTDVIPEPALRRPGPEHANYHTGRGGEGNVHREKYGGHSEPQKEHHHHAEKEGEGEGGKKGLGEKVKHLLHMDGHHGRKSGERSREGTPGA
ncbi:hypothetical protein IWZ03DRAFT_99672 [Phyllosticta citriasiana]|uniref:Dehydrin n=1 Tax=Phyllosticta citriasiana TaxID=595635 RepID=A0ABR1KVM2_9PEZI